MVCVVCGRSVVDGLAVEVGVSVDVPLGVAVDVSVSAVVVCEAVVERAFHERTGDLVASAFDTLVQFREVDDRLEARVATQNGPSPWTTVSAAA